jgi:hypothetical protein
MRKGEAISVAVSPHPDGDHKVFVEDHSVVKAQVLQRGEWYRTEKEALEAYLESMLEAEHNIKDRIANCRRKLNGMN